LLHLLDFVSNRRYLFLICLQYPTSGKLLSAAFLTDFSKKAKLIFICTHNDNRFSRLLSCSYLINMLESELNRRHCTALMITFDQAIEHILSDTIPLPSQVVSTADCIGRVLAKPLIAPIDMPRFDNSAMDGYAVLASDIETATQKSPVSLRVLETIYAGCEPENTVQPGTACCIMTGAMLPKGADCIAIVEDTDRGLDNVRIYRSSSPERYIRRRGEDFQTGTPLLSSGNAIGPAEMGLLAYVGKVDCEVSRRPRVAILSTGDELVPAGNELHGACIYDSNGPTIASLARWAGAEAIVLGTGRDDKLELEDKVRRGLQCDLLVTTGGVSAGRKDYLREVLENIGWEEIFYKVAVKPGKPVLFGKCDGTSVIGLPGNPVSSTVCFSLFAWPLIRAMQGCIPVMPDRFHAIAGEDMKCLSGRESFPRVLLRTDCAGKLYAYMTRTSQEAGIFSSMRGAMGLARIPVEGGGIRKGEIVEILPLLGGGMEEGFKPNGS
jgi:molybdopterin molybdotransferase